MIDPMTMGAVHPTTLETNLERLHRVMRDRQERVTEPETVAIANVVLVMIRAIRNSPTESAYRGGYRSLYILALDGVRSTRTTDERRRLYITTANLMEGLDA